MQTDVSAAFDNNLVFEKIPITEIHADEEFNCRGHINPASVIDLMRDIQDHGLINPIVVRKRRETDPEGYPYSLVAGFRRLAAYKFNNITHIPARILEPSDDGFTERTTNGRENLKRSNLNIMQEAKVVAPYHEAHWSRDEIAKELGVSPGWVQIRIMLLNLEPEIQECAAAGIISQDDIRTLNGMKNTTDRFDAIKNLKIAREQGEHKKKTIVPKKTIKPMSKCHRKRPDILYLMHQIQESLGNSLTTRVLAWAAGEISSFEVYHDLREACKLQGVTYEFPEYEESA